MTHPRNTETSVRLRSSNKDSRSRRRERDLETRTLKPGIRRARRKFTEVFPDGFFDETYIEWERNYKWQAHLQWNEQLSDSSFSQMLKQRRFTEVCQRAIRIESRTNLLFSFEKMALRDAVRSAEGAKCFATALYEFLHGKEEVSARFETWVEAVGTLPRRQTRVLTWPLATVFGFIA